MFGSEIAKYLGRPTALLALMLNVGLTACERAVPPSATVPTDWQHIEAAARGHTVSMAMWQGDPAINAYMRDFVVPRVLIEHGITLKLIALQGDAIVSALLSETEAGRPVSALDLVWINGETFYQLRQIHALYGPFTNNLPNQQYIDWNNPFIGRDFQQPVEGYECPWGNVQLLLITDHDRVPTAPADPPALAAWIHAHPGRFTFDTGFTGMSFLKSLMYAYLRQPDALQGSFDPAVYAQLRSDVFSWLDSVRHDLWHRGETFPMSTAQLHELFANGEVDFTMSFNDGEVDNRIASGLFPAAAMAFPLKSGTVQNTHYVGIVNRSSQAGAAMVVANFLISPEAQLRKLAPAIWGDGTVLNVKKLPEFWRSEFAKAEVRSHAPARSAIRPYARAEPSPQLMIELSSDFRRRFLHD